MNKKINYDESFELEGQWQFFGNKGESLPASKSIQALSLMTLKKEAPSKNNFLQCMSVHTIPCQ